MRTPFLLLLLAACSAPVATPDGGSAGGGLSGSGGGGATGGGGAGGAAFDAGPPPVSHLDPSFGTNGCLQVPFNPASSDEFTSVTVTDDGTIWVAGAVTPADAGDRSQSDAVAVVKVSSAGQLDTSFGDQGRVRFQLARTYHKVNALVPRADGLVVAVAPTNQLLSLVKLTPSGALDRAFGDGGVVVTTAAPPSRVASLVVEEPGGLLVASRGGFNELAFERFGNDGQRQPSLRTGLQGFSPQGALRDFDGGLVVAGQAFSEMLLARVQPSDGGLDDTFAVSGKRRLAAGGTLVRSLVQLGDGSYRVVLHLNGPAVLVGATKSGGVDARLSPDAGVVAIPGGTTDRGVEVKRGLFGVTAAFEDLSSDPEVGNTDMAVALLQLDGGLDVSAPNGGYLVAHVPNQGGRALDLTRQADGKLLLVGQQTSPTTATPVICRLIVP